MNLFGMITTSRSREYTPVALKSFFERTPLKRDDRFILIDNNGDFVLPDEVPAERLTVVRHAEPQGFARNANLLLAEARKGQADLFLLNNDLVFTSGWLEPLLSSRRALLSPMSNAEVAYAAGALRMQPAMDLSDYVGHESDLEAIARSHRRTHSGYKLAATAPFFCIKIPRVVYETVGDFDERFGQGGAEDRDYTIRAWIAGIPLEYALESFVLHFQGRSTWRGGETPEEQRQRDAHYLNAFQAKWGASLTQAFVRGDWSPFRSNAKLAEQITQQQFTPVVRYLRSHPSLDAFRPKADVPAHPVAMYLDLLESALLNTLYEDPPMDGWAGNEFNPERRHLGRDWPSQAHTMIGRLRMRQLRYAVITALRDGVPGDLIETGVWRGGACVYMAGILRALNQQARKVWVADSFAGLPPPDVEKYPADAGDQHYTMKQLAVSLDDVRQTFARYDLLGDNIQFLKGWFSDTLPTAPIDKLAVLRLDGDMYGSTWDAIDALYPKLSPGGFCIIDDFGAVEGCRKAIMDYRERFGITDPIQAIDGMGAFWRKS
jgi:O-methyltransferase/8-demethyl-8-(2,3-dimethoxy-alpha-L-rhamnosyl)tetracenomycin-C 4'-O-methyltransferase